MYKKKVIILIILVFLFGISVDKFLFTNKKEDLSTEKSTSNKSSRPLSMMLETGSNTGQYELTTRSTWPTDGYIFNASLSNCENGSQITWDETNATITYHGNKTDKCYIYFDKYSLAVINSLTEDVTTNSITVTLSATEGTKAITKYYYSSDNGTNYTESTSNAHTFTGLKEGTTYNIKAYAVDEKGKSSEVYTKSVKTLSPPTLAEYVKSKYTGTQGSNGIYLHNGTIKSGTTVIDANDDSYRYAGASPNNYVCFGSTASTCPNDNLYRIIGVFEDQAKLIKYDYATSTLLGTGGADCQTVVKADEPVSSNYKGSLRTINQYCWTSSSNSSNVWSGSALNTTNLNGTYLTHLGTTWTDKIATTTWKVGGNTRANIATLPMYQAYQKEIVSPAESTTYSAKIGLMYVSDYGYAASPTYWTYLGYSGSPSNTNDYSAAINANWMYMGLNEWTITRRSDASEYAFLLDISGIYSGFGTVNISSSVRPVFYLTSSVNYVSGTGTSNDPIRIE